ncbi:hypothetical protein RhiirA5_422731, partial [Rhizophagus irregularis]
PSGSQDESQSYGNCSECKQKRTAVAWCKNCDIAIFKEIFFENINKRGDFSSVYSAVWMEGPRTDEEAEAWNRYGPIKVILKRLNNSKNMSLEFINQPFISIKLCINYAQIVIKLMFHRGE